MTVRYPVKLELNGMWSVPSFSTLALSGSIWKGTIYGSNRTVWHLNWVQTNDSLSSIVWNETVWSFKYVLTNDWCLIDLFIIHSNTWHCWRSSDELISDVLLWTPTYGRAKAGQPVRTYIPQLCEDTVCSSEDLPEAMNDTEKWRERVRDIFASSTTWLRWWWC